MNWVMKCLFHFGANCSDLLARPSSAGLHQVESPPAIFILHVTAFKIRLPGREVLTGFFESCVIRCVKGCSTMVDRPRTVSNGKEIK